MQKIWTPKLTEILPENILADAKLRATAEALDVELARLSAATREVLHLPRLEELSGRILDYLAEQFHVDFYEPLYLNEDEKKNLIRTSIAWHRIKGTVGAVEQIAQSCFRDAEIQEWFEYGGEPGYFRITSKGWKLTPDGFDTFLRMIWAAKNVRSWLDKLIVDYSPKDSVEAFAGIAQTNIGLKIIDVGRPRDIRQTVRSGAAIVGGGKRTISLGLPRILLGNEIRRTLGMAYVRRGDITIEAYQGDLPKHEDLIESAIADLLIANVGIARAGEIKIPVETYERAFRLNSFGGAGLNVFGAKKLDLPRPRDQRQKFFTGIGFGKLGGVTLKTLPEVRTRTKTIMRAGATLYRTGKITIESFDKPSPPPPNTGH